MKQISDLLGNDFNNDKSCHKWDKTYMIRKVYGWWISNESWNRFLDNANNSYIDFIQNPSLKERTLSHRLNVKIFRMALFKAVLQSLMSVAEKVFTSHAYEFIGTQLVYKSFMRTSSYNLTSKIFSKNKNRTTLTIPTTLGVLGV